MDVAIDLGMTDEMTRFYGKIRQHYDIDCMNLFIAETNELNAMLGHPERHKLLKYPS